MFVSTMTKGLSVIAPEFSHDLIGAPATRTILPDPAHRLQPLLHFLLRVGRQKGLSKLQGPRQELPRFGFHRALVPRRLLAQLLLHALIQIANRQRSTHPEYASIACNAVNRAAGTFGLSRVCRMIGTPQPPKREESIP